MKLRTSIMRSAAIAAGTALAFTTVATASAAPDHESTHAPSTASVSEASALQPMSKTWKNVWHTAPSYYSGTRGPTGGHLYAGSNYFYCQAQGGEYNALGYHNNWWLLTDDDDHHSNVWVNAVYVSGGGNDQAIPGVPHC